MILPTIHLNGTSPEMLKEGYLAAWRAINTARDALTAVEFNGRDYYPQGNEAWSKARAEHDARLDKLTETAAELMVILEHVQDVIDEKERDESS